MDFSALDFIATSPRPVEVGLQELDDWLDEFKAAQKAGEVGEGTPEEVMSILFPNWKRVSHLQVWICGQWLHRELLRAGCHEDLAGRIVFALGQVVAVQLDPDPWTVVHQALDDYHVGQYLEPGDELAIRLMADLFSGLVERFGQPSPDAIMRAQQLAANMQAPPTP
jgi:hypothetical protein